MTETEQTAYEQSPVGFFSALHSSVAAPSEGEAGSYCIPGTETTSRNSKNMGATESQALKHSWALETGCVLGLGRTF